MEDRIIISSTPAESFLVKDSSLKDIDAPFLCWLRENGFKMAWYKGHYDCCDWVYVNITEKLFAYGMPGVPITTPVGNHAITMSEFFTIYYIYDNYNGLDQLVMDRNAVNENAVVQTVGPEYTYEDFLKEVRAKFEQYSYTPDEIDAYFSRPDIIEFLKDNYEGYTTTDIGGYKPAATASCLDMMYV